MHLKPRSQQHLPLSLQQGKVNVPRRTGMDEDVPRGQGITGGLVDEAILRK